MKRNETIEILKILSTFYPKEYNAYNAETAKIRADVFTRALGNFPYEAVSDAVHSLIEEDEKREAPTLGAIKSRTKLLIDSSFRLEETVIDGEECVIKVPVGYGVYANDD